MPARCPECDQTNPVSPAQLQLEGGLVACRHCGALFDALPRIVRQAADDWPLAPGWSSATAGLPPVPSGVVEEAWPAPADERRGAGSRRRLVLLGALLTLLLLLAYALRPPLAQLPGVSLLAEAGCRAGARLGLPCASPAGFDPAALDLRGHRLTRTGDDAGELAFAARLINRGNAAQPLPVIELTLEDRNGAALARERFGPQRYLAAPTATPPGAIRLPPGGELAVQLALPAPAREVAGYRFLLRPPTAVGAGGEAD